MTLDLQVVQYIRSINIEKRPGKFQITDHLSYSHSIFGLKLPLAYEEVVKNPNFLTPTNQPTNSTTMVELNQFKKQPEQTQGQKAANKDSPSTDKPKQGSTPVEKPKQPATEKPKREVANFSKPKEAKDKIFD